MMLKAHGGGTTRSTRRAESGSSETTWADRAVNDPADTVHRAGDRKPVFGSVDSRYQECE